MYSAMADLAEQFNDNELLQVCDTLWNNIVNKRMYITGSIGSSGLLERFTTDYDCLMIAITLKPVQALV